MKKRFLPLLLLGIALNVSAQTVLTSPTGEGYVYSYDGSSDYGEYLINVPDAGYLEIDLYLEAYDYGFAVMEVYDEDEEMEYFVFVVDPFQSPAFEYFSETIVVPNNSLVILACYDEAYADFFTGLWGSQGKSSTHMINLETG